MNRRNFVKTLGAIAAGCMLAVGVNLPSKKDVFDPIDYAGDWEFITGGNETQIVTYDGSGWKAIPFS